MAQGPLDWPTLYKVYEIVRDSFGGQAALVRHAPWTTKAEITAFAGSANRPDVSGEGARHARLGGDPPRRTMSLHEGREFIGRLARHWIDDRLSGR